MENGTMIARRSLTRDISDRERFSLFYKLDTDATHCVATFAHEWCLSVNGKKTCLVFSSKNGKQIPTKIKKYLDKELQQLKFEATNTKTGELTYKVRSPPDLAQREFFRSNACAHFRLAGYVKNVTPGIITEQNHISATDLLYELSLCVLQLMMDEKLMVQNLRETDEVEISKIKFSGGPKENETVLGFNQNNGHAIHIFLRPKLETRRRHIRGQSVFDAGRLFSLPELEKTMLHELAHNKFGNSVVAHPKEFDEYLEHLYARQVEIQSGNIGRSLLSRRTSAEAALKRAEEDKELMAKQRKRKRQRIAKMHETAAKRIKATKVGKSPSVRIVNSNVNANSSSNISSSSTSSSNSVGSSHSSSGWSCTVM